MSKFPLTASSQFASNITDPLTEWLKSGARELIAQAVEAELQALLSQHADVRLQDGRQAVVRNGYLPERTVQTSIGDIKVRVPKARDRSGSGVSFSSRLLPPYLKRTSSIDGRLLCLYLKSISTGDFRESLTALLGNQARMLSASTISRISGRWLEENSQWRCRDLSNKRYVYWWADGVHADGVNYHARMDNQLSLLVITGVTESGRKELVVVEEGYRQSAASWEDLLAGLRERGLETPPELAIGDGVLGFWKAMTKIYPACRHQFCWAHKTAAVLSKLPESKRSKTKRALHDIWMAASEDEARAAFDGALLQLGPKYSKAMNCLARDRNELLEFYNFPAELWVHIRRPSRLNPPSPQPGGVKSAITAFKSQRWLWPVSC